jgi:hypothetical protein
MHIKEEVREDLYMHAYKRGSKGGLIHASITIIWYDGQCIRSTGAMVFQVSRSC